MITEDFRLKVSLSETKFTTGREC